MVSLGLGLGDGGVHLRNCRNGAGVATAPVGRSQTMLIDANVMRACPEDQHVLLLLSENRVEGGIIETVSPFFQIPNVSSFPRSVVARRSNGSIF